MTLRPPGPGFSARGDPVMMGVAPGRHVQEQTMKGRRTWAVWGYPAAGFAAAGLAAAVPGSPLGPGGWPLRGPFGAFTWSAWFVSTALGVTLAFLAAGLALRRGRAARGALAGRVAPAGGACGGRAAPAHPAAARARP